MADPTRVSDDELDRIDLGLHPNEASGLCAIESEDLLERLDWTEGFWTILDDGPIERCIAAIGHARDDDRWLVRRLVPPEPPTGFPDTDDGEAIAVYDGVVYAFGSLYGAKDGPLELERQFLARFREEDVRVIVDDDNDDDEDPVTAPLEVVGDEFRLHRAINDALRDSGLPLLEPGPKVRKKTVQKARKKAIEDEAEWSYRVRWDDHPINIEGAAFLPSGACVVGLRIPVHADGHPMVVVIEGIDRAFVHDDVHPRVVGVHVLSNVGDPYAPAGIRDLAIRGGSSLHLLAGNLDSTGKGSVLLDAVPEGARAVSTQWHVDLTEGVLPSRDLGAVPDRVFPDLYRVEGLAYGRDHRPRYVVDEDDNVGLRLDIGDD